MRKEACDEKKAIIRFNMGRFSFGKRRSVCGSMSRHVARRLWGRRL
jgi:hypothetical protein